LYCYVNEMTLWILDCYNNICACYIVKIIIKNSATISPIALFSERGVRLGRNKSIISGQNIFSSIGHEKCFSVLPMLYFKIILLNYLDRILPILID